MYINMYIHIHIYIFVYTHRYIHIYICVYTHKYSDMYVYVYTCVYMCTYLFMCIYVCKSKNHKFPVLLQGTCIAGYTPSLPIPCCRKSFSTDWIVHHIVNHHYALGWSRFFFHDPWHSFLHRMWECSSPGFSETATPSMILHCRQLGLVGELHPQAWFSSGSVCANSMDALFTADAHQSAPR